MITVNLPLDDLFSRCERTEGGGYKLVLGPVGHGLARKHVYSDNPLSVRDRHEGYANRLGYAVERQEHRGQAALLITKPPGEYVDKLLITYSYREQENI